MKFKEFNCLFCGGLVNSPRRKYCSQNCKTKFFTRRKELLLNSTSPEEYLKKTLGELSPVMTQHIAKKRNAISLTRTVTPSGNISLPRRTPELQPLRLRRGDEIMITIEVISKKRLLEDE